MLKRQVAAAFILSLFLVILYLLSVSLTGRRPVPAGGLQAASNNPLYGYFYSEPEEEPTVPGDTPTDCPDINNGGTATDPWPEPADTGLEEPTAPPAADNPTATPPPPKEDSLPEGVYYQDKVIVLIYHHIDPRESTDAVVSPERFKSHIAMLLSRGYKFIDLETFHNFLSGGFVPDNAVMITFDDGYESLYIYAYPLLAKHNIPAVSFPVVGDVGKKPGYINHYSWEQAREMAAAGIISMSHTYDLHSYELLDDGSYGPVIMGPLENQTIEEFVEMVYLDLRQSIEKIEQNMGYTAHTLCLPYGRADKHFIQTAARAGFKIIFTTQTGAVTRQSNPLYLPRLNAGSPRISAEDLDQLIRKTGAKEQ